MITSDRDGWIWLDGTWLPWRDAATHVMTHTLHYGLGVFEGVRAYSGPGGTHVFRLRDHTRRLIDSARILQIEIPFDADTLDATQVEALRRNGLTDGYVRPLVFLGPEKLGIDPVGTQAHVAIAAWAWGSYLGPRAIEHGIRVRTSSFQRHHVNVQMCRSKSVSTYANSILACREARADGYDEALLLDTDGFVSEGSGENVFVVRDGRLYEPDTASALDGITRRTVHTLAAEAGLEVQRKRITRDEAWIADEVFFTGTAAEITPVVELDRRHIGDGKPGPVTRTLQSAYFAAVRGEGERHRGWLTRVGTT
ncbi:MAG: branched-chain amino acid transaminase [Burkholderiales bacterium]|nr:branched-chain amino acid transaminase [Burkholderiales bacterium]